MKQQAGLERYTRYVRNEAYQALFHQGLEPGRPGNDQEYWKAFHKAAVAAEARLHGPRQLRRSARGPDVRAPVALPVVHSAPPEGTFSGIQSVGTVRGLYLAAAPSGGFSVTLKATLHSGQKVYRYGHLDSLEGFDSLIQLWIRKGYWTPDKQ